jgi:hypothetical protein
MSNICECYLTITGDYKDLEVLYNRLMDQDPTILETVPNFRINPKSDYCISSKDFIILKPKPNRMTISFCGRNLPPLEELSDLSSEYPELNFHLIYEEPGNEIFGEATISDGGYYNNEMEERAFMEAHNGGYKEERKSILELPYDEFVKEYTHGKFFEEHPYGWLDLDIVNRIKDKDLPLFINRQWMDSDAERIFKARLAGDSTVEPSTED